MLGDLGYIGIFLIVAILFPAGGILTSYFIQPKKPSALKSTPYESGMAPIGQAWVQYHVRYYLYALIFVIFDIETVFLYPWAVQFRQLGLLAFVEVVLFVIVLLVAYIYAWRARALEWS